MWQLQCIATLSCISDYLSPFRNEGGSKSRVVESRCRKIARFDPPPVKNRGEMRNMSQGNFKVGPYDRICGIHLDGRLLMRGLPRRRYGKNATVKLEAFRHYVVRPNNRIPGNTKQRLTQSCQRTRQCQLTFSALKTVLRAIRLTCAVHS